MFLLISLLTACFSVAYFCLNALYILTWRKMPSNYYLPASPQHKATIVVVARDEAARIGALIDALVAQNYPQNLFEIVIVDDHSSDQTPKIVQKYQQNYPNIRLLHLADDLAGAQINAFKKRAISYALRQTQSEWIVCTDADCTMGPDWLAAMLAAGEARQADAVLAPVVFEEGRAGGLFLRRFQQLDLMGMMIITGTGVELGTHLANGANFAYRRQAYEETGGFTGKERFASGDDMLLLHQIANNNRRICFVKHPAAIVETEVKTTWRSLWQQRLRWATKSRSYTQFQLLMTLSVVWIFCALPIMLSIFAAIYKDIYYVYLIVFQVFIKLFIDYILLHTAAKFFNRRAWLWAFPVAVFMHWTYIVLVGFFGNLVSNYKWKGRKVQ